MTIAFRSVATAAWQTVTSGNPLNITKPSGLIAGDEMVAHLSNVVGGSNNADGWNTPSGWTLLTDTNSEANLNSSARLTVFYKTADSSDAAAASFDFIKSGSQGTTVVGSLYAVSSAAFTTGAAATATDSGGPTFSNTVTPTANSLLLFLTTIADAGQTTGSISGYAITTSNPTWTERADSVGNIGAHRGLAGGATATRPEATATGNSTCSFVNFTQNSVGVIVAISPILDATATPDTFIGTISIPAPDGTGSATLTTATLIGTLSIPAPTPSTPSSMWTNLNKS